MTNDTLPETPATPPDAVRIGVYGGTFDPIHNAHLAMARAALTTAGLDRVLFVVAARPPHKISDAATSPEDRYAMVAAALAEEPRMEPSRVELDRSGPSYMADTLRILHAASPEARLHLIIGMDSLVDLLKWREPEVILAHARLLAVPRPGVWRVPERLKDCYDILEFNETSLSSTNVRARLLHGKPVSDALPPSVLEVIHKRGLYAPRLHGKSR